MKTSEQMTIDVLKRRDEELKAQKAPVRRVMAAAVPCAAAIAVTAAAAGIYIGAERLANTVSVPETAGMTSEIGEIEIGKPDIYLISEPDNILKNPNSGKYKYYFIFANGLLSGIKGIEGYPVYDLLSEPEYTFIPHDIESLNKYYGIEFDRLGRLHSDWSESHDRPFGIYVRDREDSMVASREISCTTNTLNYTAPNGAKLTVTGQQRQFVYGIEEVVIGESPYMVYDEDGNKLDEYENFFMPSSVIPEKDGSVKVEIYTDADDHSKHLAYIDMGIWVKIYAEGLSDEEFFEIIKEYAE